MDSILVGTVDQWFGWQTVPDLSMVDTWPLCG